MSDARIAFSTSESYFPAARQELRAAFPAARIDRLGPELGSLEGDAVAISDVAEACRARPVVFVRHLMREIGRIPIAVTRGGLDDLTTAILDHVEQAPAPIANDVALHVWTTGQFPVELRPDDLRHRLVDELARLGIETARSGRDHVLSVCLTPAATVVGYNRTANALADWPGGRVRLARDRHQVSRSEFKLEELFKLVDVNLPAGGTAIDLGASPGGWTRIVRRLGMTVWAVDPGDLDPRVASDPSVHHVRTTAGPFLFTTDRTFDLVLNDMRMAPALSCTLMLDAARRLNLGALAIVTLKLTPSDALALVRESMSTLNRAYDVIFARQLYHNRNEVTVVARLRPPIS